MDTVGTFSMAKSLAEHKAITTVHKHYSVDEWRAFAQAHPDVIPYVGASTGTSEEDLQKLKTIVNECKVNLICIDVANGYSEHFVAFVRRAREEFKSQIIIAGNVVTAEMTEELILSGADIVKVGIGPGSFVLSLLFPT